MSDMRELVETILEQVRVAQMVGGYDLVGDKPDSVGDLIEYERAADEVVKAAHAVRAALRHRLAAQLGTDGAARYGDIIYRVGRTVSWKVVDPHGLAEWLGPDWAKVVRVSGDTLRRTGLRGLAQQRGQDPAVVQDTFIVEERSDLDLQVMPADKAPKFLQALGDGEVRLSPF
jgi:hypothetical protein